MDVGVWPQSLGLEQYETLFRENYIDVEVLSDLTDGDFEKIGVSLIRAPQAPAEGGRGARRPRASACRR